MFAGKTPDSNIRMSQKQQDFLEDLLSTSTFRLSAEKMDVLLQS